MWAKCKIAGICFLVRLLIAVQTGRENGPSAVFGLAHLFHRLTGTTAPKHDPPLTTMAPAYNNHSLL